MSKIKDLLEEIKRSVDEETQGKIATTLAKIGSEYNELSENFDIVKNESVKRKEKIRDELMPKITQYEDEIEDWKKKADTTEFQAELSTLREFKKSQLKNQRTTFVKTFDGIVKHPNFEKAKTRFTLPELEDEKYQWDKISDADMEKNISELNDLNELEYFKTGKEKPGTFGDRFSDVKDDKPPEIKDSADMRSYLRQKIIEENAIE